MLTLAPPQNFDMGLMTASLQTSLTEHMQEGYAAERRVEREEFESSAVKGLREREKAYAATQRQVRAMD